MQDRAVVAAVIAGDTDGFGAAYDQHAASLYARCHAVLPEPEAAEAVLDTFLVAAAKLDELRDPDRFGPWLHAVARNECLRRLGSGATIPAPADQGGEPQELPLPPGLRSQVLTACADNSPAGRAHRMSVAHRAGAFGPAGFPKAIGPSGPSWWRRVRRHPGVVAGVAAAAALAMTAGITVAMTAGASHRPQASAPRLDAGVPAPSSGTTPVGASKAPSPARSASASASSPASAGPTSLATVLAGTTSAAPAPGRNNPLPSASPSPAPSASPSPFPSTATSPALGYLTVAPVKLVLTSVSGKPVSGSFVLTAVGGPVPSYAVGVATLASKVKVTPAGGSLRVNGSVKVTVTVTSKVALTTHVIVEPGNLTVTVVYKLKP
jgi:Sigma-70 region 2